MALASWPARHGQQRSLRRMRQVLSWRLRARRDCVSVGPTGGPLRFWLVLPLVRGADVVPGAVVALVCQHDQARARARATQSASGGGTQADTPYMTTTYSRLPQGQDEKGSLCIDHRG